MHYEEEQEEDMETETAPQESIGGWTEVKPDSENEDVDTCIYAHTPPPPPPPPPPPAHRKKTSIKKPSRMWLVGL